MRLKHHLAFALFLASLTATLTPAIAHAGTQDEAAIRTVLNTQVEAWNRGDVVAFMQGYNNSPDTTFVGKTIQHGFANILARYQTTFAGKEKMGQLAFDNLEVHPLDAHVALVTGRYHLTRSANGGGDAQGIFSLVFEKTPAGWKIVLDHTS